MALVKCVECARQVSTLADACPHCGAPLKHSIPEETEEEVEHDHSGTILKVFLLLVVLGLGYIYAKPHIDKYLAKRRGGTSSSPRHGGTRSLGDKIRGTGQKSAPSDDGQATDVTRILNPRGDDNDDAPEGKGAGDVMRGALGIGAKEEAEPEPPKPAKGPIVEIEAPKKKSPDKKTEPVIKNVEPRPPVAEKPASPAAKVTIPPEPPAKTPASPAAKVGNAKLNRILAQAKEEKIKVVDNLWIDEEGKLIVVVNRDWSILSCDQREEVAKAISGFWRKEKGEQCEFQGKNGEVVAKENRTARYIKGKVRFRIKDCEK